MGITVAFFRVDVDGLSAAVRAQALRGTVFRQRRLGRVAAFQFFKTADAEIRERHDRPKSANRQNSDELHVNLLLLCTHYAAMQRLDESS